MERARSAQLNIRSDFARERAADLARQTGMTKTQVVEAALKAFDPHDHIRPVGRLVKKGRLLVMPSDETRTLTVEEVQRSMDEAREERMDDIWNAGR
mgnify:CR=1 FL=1